MGDRCALRWAKRPRGCSGRLKIVSFSASGQDVVIDELEEAQMLIPMRTFVPTAVAALVGLASVASAGPDWTEGSAGSAFDAPSLPPDADQPKGLGPLSTIGGSLTGIIISRGLVTDADFEDLYIIDIFDPIFFAAFTDGADPMGLSASTFDTQLFLFDCAGFPVLANQDSPNPMPANPQGSFLQAMSTDGTGAVIPGPGLYYLAISGAPNESLGQLAQPQFQFDDPLEISGPDGPDGMSPVAQWAGPGAVGSYLIVLEGAEFARSCQIWDFNGDGAVGASDLAQLIGRWGNPYGSAELAELLGFWGACTPGCPDFVRANDRVADEAQAESADLDTDSE